MKRLCCAMLVAAVLMSQTGCDLGVSGLVDDLLWGFGSGFDTGSLAGGGFYDDGSWGNWLTDSYVSTDGNGNSAIWVDGVSCLNGECF